MINSLISFKSLSRSSGSEVFFSIGTITSKSCSTASNSRGGILNPSAMAAIVAEFAKYWLVGLLYAFIAGPRLINSGHPESARLRTDDWVECQHGLLAGWQCNLLGVCSFSIPQPPRLTLRPCLFD